MPWDINREEILETDPDYHKMTKAELIAMCLTLTSQRDSARNNVVAQADQIHRALRDIERCERIIDNQAQALKDIAENL